jgi:ABC-type lipoprotein release transport system permease subunit
MLIGEIFRVALEAIRANKLRSFLTILGIIIGIAAVITMVALGEGAQRSVQEQIRRMGTNVLTVRPPSPRPSRRPPAPSPCCSPASPWCRSWWGESAS